MHGAMQVEQIKWFKRHKLNSRYNDQGAADAPDVECPEWKQCYEDQTARGHTGDKTEDEKGLMDKLPKKLKRARELGETMVIVTGPSGYTSESKKIRYRLFCVQNDMPEPVSWEDFLDFLEENLRQRTVAVSA